MKINDIRDLKNNDYIVLLPDNDYDIRDSVEYSFNNVVYLDYKPQDDEIKILIDSINEKNIQLILFDYSELYRLIIPYIHKNKKVKWILKNDIASMTDGKIRATYTNLMEFCDRDLIDCIGFLDYGTYKVFEKSKYNTNHIVLDIEEKKAKKMDSNDIGIIGDDYNPNHNIYNELTAVTMAKYDNIKILKNMPATKHFIEFFNIREKEVSTLDEVISNNYVNLYCNFTLTNNELILKSMDQGIPCILGNTDIFDNYKYLKEKLVLISDDDVNEIAEKINNIKTNKSKILEEYKKFRKEYKEKAKETITEFLNE